MAQRYHLLWVAAVACLIVAEPTAGLSAGHQPQGTSSTAGTSTSSTAGQTPSSTSSTAGQSTSGAPGSTASTAGQSTSGAPASTTTTTTSSSTSTTGPTQPPAAPTTPASSGLPPLVPANMRGYVITNWPVTFVSGNPPGYVLPTNATAIPTPSAAASTLANLSTVLSAVFPDVTVRPAGDTLLIAGPKEHVRIVKTILAKWIDVPFPQVSVNAMAFQATAKGYNGDTDDAVQNAEAGIKLARAFIRAYTLDIANYIASPPSQFYAVNVGKYHVDDVKDLFFRFNLLGTNGLDTEEPECLEDGRKRVKPFVDDLAYMAVSCRDMFCDKYFCPKMKDGAGYKLLNSAECQLDAQIKAIKSQHQAGKLTDDEACRGTKQAQSLIKLCELIKSRAYPAYKLFTAVMTNTNVTSDTEALLEFMREYGRPNTYAEMNRMMVIKDALAFDTRARDNLGLQLNVAEQVLSTKTALKKTAIQRAADLYQQIYAVKLPPTNDPQVLKLQFDIADTQSVLAQKQARLTTVAAALLTGKSGTTLLSQCTLNQLRKEDTALEGQISDYTAHIRIRSVELASYGITPPAPASSAGGGGGGGGAASSANTPAVTTTTNITVPPQTPSAETPDQTPGAKPSAKPKASPTPKATTTNSKPAAKGAKPGSVAKAKTPPPCSTTVPKTPPPTTPTPLITIQTATTTGGSSSGGGGASSAAPAAAGSATASPAATSATTAAPAGAGAAGGGATTPSAPTSPVSTLRTELAAVILDVTAIQADEAAAITTRDGLLVQYDNAKQNVDADTAELNLARRSCGKQNDLRPVDPEHLALMAANVDEMIKNATDAVTADIDNGVVSPLKEWILDYNRGQKSGLVTTGQLEIAVTSSRGAATGGATTFYSPFTPQQSLSSSQLTTLLGASSGVSAFSTAGLSSILGALTNLGGGNPLYSPIYSTVAPGLDLAILPSVLPGGRSARLQINFKTTNSAADTDSTKPRPNPIDTLNSHEVRTDVAVNAFDLFPLSSFSEETTALGDPQWRIYGLEGLPILGNMFIGPRRPITTVGRSLIIVYTTILPRSLDLARRYSGSSE